MAITPPVLLLEFNELAPRLMDQFMAAGQLPNFKILHDESEIYGTEAVEKYPLSRAMDPVDHGPCAADRHCADDSQDAPGPPAGVHARRGLAPESLIARPVVGVDIDATSGYSLST
jgi:hypothetical protein